MAAPRRSHEIDQSTQRFHVGCDNRCLLGNEYGGLHGRDFLGRTLIILNKSSSFCNIVCGKDTSIGADIFILTLNHADVIGNQSDAVTQNAWFLCALCCHLWRDININTNQGRVLGKVSCTKNLPLGEYTATCTRTKSITSWSSLTSTGLGFHSIKQNSIQTDSKPRVSLNILPKVSL